MATSQLLQSGTGTNLWIPAALVIGNAPGTQPQMVGSPSAILANIRLAQFSVTAPLTGLSVCSLPKNELVFGCSFLLPRVPPSATIPCDGWCYGEPMNHFQTGRPDARWYRLSPAARALFETARYQCPVAGTGWSQTYGSPFHRVDRGYAKADDRHAFDLNQADDGDAGKPVRPVCGGDVVLRDPNYGYIVLKHTAPLKLRNGRSIQPWLSGYMHMSSLTSKSSVTLLDELGKISNKTAGGSVRNHLHFAVYQESSAGSLCRLKSIDINLLPTEILTGITKWVDWRGASAVAITGPLDASILGL